MKILVLDDEPNIVDGIVFMIKKLAFPHCSVLGFSDPESALAEYRKTQVDISFVDIMMPGMTGLEFIEKAQAVISAEGSGLFVILSGYSDFSYAQQAIRLSVREYLVKPVDENALARILGKTFYEIYHITPEDYSTLLALGDGDYDVKNMTAQNPSRNLKIILQYIDAHIGGDLSICMLGEVTGLNQNYISDLFAREMHIGLHKYIESLKLLKAMRYLKNNEEQTIAGIAAELGYFNERQLFRMFKKYTGKTPGQFRAEAADQSKTQQTASPAEKQFGRCLVPI